MATLDQTPRFSVQEAARLVRDLYGLEGEATPLPGERDQNFRVRIEGGEKFVLKIANGREPPQRLTAESHALDRVARQTGLSPSVRPTLRGESFGVAPPPSPTGEPRKGGSSSGPEPVHRVRLLTWIPGTPLARVSRRSPRLLRDLGRSLGRVDAALMDLQDLAFTREAFAWDLLHGRRLVERHLDGIGQRELESRMRSFVRRFARETEPALSALRVSVIHNDANDHNVLVRSHLHDQAVTGIIDFGDLTRTLTVAEPAIAAAYAMLDQPDPLHVISNLVAGYHETRPLSGEELHVLYDLALLRLFVSVCMASVQQHQRPEDPYLGISQGPIRRTLPDLMDLPAGLARAALRNACGLDPVPSATLLTERLKQRSKEVAPILPTDLRESPSRVLDLGVASPLVTGEPAQNPAPLLGRRIDASLWDEDSRDSLVGVGRYGEARLTYTGPAFTTASGETRTIHLGLDLFAPAGTPIHAPVEGVVHAVADRGGHLDYGPIVILRHGFASPGEEQDELEFYTLYGHLDRASLARLQVGQTIARGEAFAALGRPSENGGWPPHLHLQLMTDLLDLDTAFPGVAPPSQRAAWLALCPDPNLLVGVPLETFPRAESDLERSLEAHRQVLGPGLSLSYRRPVKFVRGWMQHLWDELGRRYLDAYNNVPHVGHSHPRVTEAISRQSALLNTNTRYLSDLRNRYAERLTATLPEPLSVCYLLNSASEANELALRLVRARTGSREMIVLEHAYHGHTTSLIDLSHYKHAGPGGTGAPSWVHVAPMPDVYRGRYRATTPEERTRAGELYAGEVGRIVAELLEGGRRPAAFMAESVPSVGGQIMLPSGYLPSAYRAVREAGGLCVADEVQTGLGRLGTHFYGFQAQDVVPDIVVLGKPLGNGHPLAAVITTPDVARAFDTGMEFFSTFGGNTVSCAAGLAVLEVVRDENLQEHALEVGDRMLAGLHRLAGRHEIIGDVRGCGLFLGVELVRDRESREPAGPEAAFVADRMRELGILVGTEGPDENVLKIRPPMPFTHEDAEILLDALGRIMAQEAV